MLNRNSELGKNIAKLAAKLTNLEDLEKPVVTNNKRFSLFK